MLSKFLQKYLRFWAKLYLARVKPKIIAVTGSAGKTSTKDAIFEVVNIKYKDRVRKSEGNLNTVYGVPLAILGYLKPPVPLDKPSSPWPWLPIIFSAPFRIWANSHTRYLILEFAADKPGDIKFSTDYIKPDVVVLTNIGHAHLEIFKTLNRIIQEKTKLIEVLKNDGWVVLNIDDKNLQELPIDQYPNVKTYALESGADITAKNIVTEIEKFVPKTIFQVVSKDKYQAQMNTLGRNHNILTALSAIACAEILGLNKKEIIDGLKNIISEKHRMQVFEGKNKSIILDDSYNANPISLKAALDVLKVLPAPSSRGKKFAVLGDMLELGAISDQAHKLIGQYAHEIADEVLAYGQLARLYNGKNFDSKEELVEYLLSKINPNDIILIKASRGMAFESIVEAIKQ